MRKLILSFFIVSPAIFNNLHAQDTLPDFSARFVGNNRIIISWVNNFRNIRQISIQRSFDSLTNYKTILTVPDPTPPQNGYADTRAVNNHMFYRIYIMLEKGVYMFSKAKRPAIDTLHKSIIDTLRKGQDFTSLTNRISGTDSVGIPNFGINNKDRPEVFTASLHVYTYKDGYVRINLPDDEKKKYAIKFFEDDDSFLFELKDIKERTFRIDKTNFYHAGWFKFELFEDGKLIEKHKFYLDKEF